MASTNGNSNGGCLPTHATASSKLADGDDLHQKHCVCVHRRRCFICGSCVVATLLLLAILLLILFLTVLCIRDLTTRLVSTRLIGLAPWLTFPALSLQLMVAVHNPNLASFAFTSGGHTDLTYHGAHIREAEIDPGRVPSKGDGNVTMALTLQADRFAGDVVQLIADVEAGSLLLEASMRIPGRMSIFGVFKRHAVTYSDFSFVFGVSELTVRSQECSDHTKL